MKLAIIGSRSFNEANLLDRTIKTYFGFLDDDTPNSNYSYRFDEIISGGAAGADRLGAQWGKANGIKVTEFLPDWNQHGKKAGFLRNQDIISNSDCVLCAWDGLSKGSGHSLSIAKKLKKPTLIIYF